MEPTEVRFKFPKSHRILKRKDFLKIQASPKRFVTGHMVFCYLEAQTEFTRLGITVTKKHGKANKRNRIKRLIREAFRLNYNFFSSRPVDIVVIARQGALDADLQVFKKEFAKFARKLNYSSPEKHR